MNKKLSKKPIGLVWQPKQTISVAEVDNPHFAPDHKVSRSNPVKIKAQINITESPLGLLAAKGLLTAAQLRAGSYFRSLYETLGTSIRAMDYSIDPVDGGGMSDPVSVRQMEAGFELKRIRMLLGPRHYDVLVRVVGEGNEISKLVSTRRERDTFMDYLKHSLEDLAIDRGYQTRISPVDNRKTAY